MRRMSVGSRNFAGVQGLTSPAWPVLAAGREALASPKSLNPVEAYGSGTQPIVWTAAVKRLRSDSMATQPSNYFVPRHDSEYESRVKQTRDSKEPGAPLALSQWGSSSGVVDGVRSLPVPEVSGDFVRLTPAARGLSIVSSFVSSSEGFRVVQPIKTVSAVVARHRSDALPGLSLSREPQQAGIVVHRDTSSVGPREVATLVIAALGAVAIRVAIRRRRR